MDISFIVPVFNRPDEVRELLQSLETQTASHDFEVILVEDGSTLPCQAEAMACSLPHLRYYAKPNSGPGPSRNYGAERARGEYLVFLDSDCILPPGYVEALRHALKSMPCDAFGGPDRAHPDFSITQKAINFAMTSFLTTGGIRGGKHKLDKFYPRSFNMGIKRSLYEALGGFSPMRFGEDIDLSLRIFQSGHTCRLLPDAWVWHKRRTNMKKFFKQVHNSGIARINLHYRHPGSMKLVHMLPAMFTLGCALLLIGAIWCWWSLLPLACYALCLFLSAWCSNRSVNVALGAVPASFIQLMGYGSGFIRAFVRRCIFHQGEFEAFKKNFYK